MRCARHLKKGEIIKDNRNSNIRGITKIISVMAMKMMTMTMRLTKEEGTTIGRDIMKPQ